MPYLVDGNNLGGALAGRSGARDRAAVLRLLLDWTRGKRLRLVVVFDGPADSSLARAYGSLEVRFGGSRSADAVILEALGSPAADWWVVSDDSALLAACRERGARTITASGLLPKLGRSRSRALDRADGGVDVADWEEWFRRGGDSGEGGKG